MTESKETRVGGLLLAAGGSKRFGRPKQLADFGGQTLLRRAAEAIAASGCSSVVVVLGPHAQESKEEIKDLNVNSIVNDEWEVGMSASIKFGLTKLFELDPAFDAVLITLMDQPLVTESHLVALVERFNESKEPVIASRYSGVNGVPALFSRQLFDELFQLQGDEGARSIIRACESVSTIALETAAVDIDEPSDFERLIDH